MGALAAWCVAVAAAAQPAASPAPSGLYETWSPVTMSPAGRLRSAPSQALLPRWLEVATTGRSSVVTFQPEGRVVWRLDWGPHGLVRKRVEVDGELVSRTRFTYDSSGHLRHKRAEGPGLSRALSWSYRTDPSGRVLERRGRLERHGPSGPPTLVTDLWTVAWRGGRAHAERQVDGQLVRTDVFNRSGLPLRTTLTTIPGHPAELRYQRGAGGRLRRVHRGLGRRASGATPHRPDPGLSAGDVAVVAGRAPVERHEALLLLGAPITHSDDASGAERTQTDDYAPDCWLNQASVLRYDATGLLETGLVTCICGFCVDAALPVEAEAVEGVDLHWTRGPWVRLDGRVDVTADHHVVTPAGSRPAGELAAGDVVLGVDGRVHRLSSVERLPEGPRRLGRNVRTAGGVFGAGGLLFKSEGPRECAAPR